MLFAPSYFIGFSKLKADLFTQEHIVPELYYVLAFTAIPYFLIGFNAVLLTSRTRNSSLKFELYNQSSRSAWKLLFIGLLAIILEPFTPGSIKYFITLLTYCIPISVLILFFNGTRIPLYLYAILSIIIGLAGGMLGHVIWPLLMLVIYITFAKYKTISMAKKVGLLGTALVLVSIAQISKFQFREETWYSSKASEMSELDKLRRYIEIYTSTSSHITPKNLVVIENMMMQRLDQGYIVNWTMKHVPRNEPFAKGETIISGILGAFVPRFLWPTKPKAGGKENMRRFAGKQIEGVSYEIGFLGEAYVNFGGKGAVVALFLWGLIVGQLINAWQNKSQHTQLAIFLPILIFVGGFNSFDITFAKSLNTLIKGLVVFWFLKMTVYAQTK